MQVQRRLGALQRFVSKPGGVLIKEKPVSETKNQMQLNEMYS